MAALAATSAFAQSSVTISGIVSASAYNTQKVKTQTGTGEATTALAPVAVGGKGTSVFNNWTTSQISFAGVEDLGSGLKASFTINSGIAGDGIGSRDTFLGLEGGFGKLQAGKFIAASSMGYHGFSGAQSTAVGSIYAIGKASTNTPRFGTVGTAGTAVTTAGLTGGDFERNSNQLQYTSPSFNGFSVNANYGKNTTVDASNLLDNTSTKTQGVGATYAQGPLSLAVGTNKRDMTNEGTATVNGGKTNAKLNWVGASYDLGFAKLTGTHVKRKDTSTSTALVATENANIKATSYGVSVPMGKYTFAASMYTGKSLGLIADTDDQKIKGRQLSVQYALSKRTSLYALNGLNDLKNTGNNTTGTSRKETLTMVGMNHSF